MIELTSCIVYGSKTDYNPQAKDALDEVLTDDPSLVAIVCFDSRAILNGKQALFHSSNIHDKHEDRSSYRYTDVSSPGFIIPGHPDFKISTAGVAHTRSLAFIKKHLGGPYFDLEKIWDEHTYYEFGDRSVEKTMATMVQEPYVNHIPTVRESIILVLFSTLLNMIS